MIGKFGQSLQDCIAVMNSLNGLESTVAAAAQCCLGALDSGAKLMVCGNGGSAAEAQHLTGELVGRYKHNRRPLAAMALAADVAVLTCVGNDFRFEQIFSRQVLALGRTGDVLIAFTTSGRSLDVLEALKAAMDRGIKTIAFLGRDGGAALPLADIALLVSHTDTARIQEAHQFLMHALMDVIESGLSEEAAG